MLTAFVAGPSGLEHQQVAAGTALPEHTVWLDLFNPTNG